jgi:hypothetical protein
MGDVERVAAEPESRDIVPQHDVLDERVVPTNACPFEPGQD